MEPILRFQRNFVIGSRRTPSGRLWKMREFNDAAGLAVFFSLGRVLFLTLFNVAPDLRARRVRVAVPALAWSRVYAVREGPAPCASL